MTGRRHLGSLILAAQLEVARYALAGGETTLAEQSIQTFQIRASSVEQVAEKLSGGNQPGHAALDLDDVLHLVQNGPEQPQLLPLAVHDGDQLDVGREL